MKTGISALNTSIQYHTGGLIQCNHQTGGKDRGRQAGRKMEWASFQVFCDERPVMWVFKIFFNSLFANTFLKYKKNELWEKLKEKYGKKQGL